MALSAGIVWEVRSASSANNGGGFKAGASGVDYSQQASPQYALTSISTAGAGAVFLTASAAADMVGNVVHVVSGTNFTVGFYEIISVVVGTSVTVDRNLTTGAGSNGVLNIGGAVDWVGTIGAVVVSGNKVFIKGGSTYTRTATTTLSGGSGSPGSASSVRLIGYTTTRTDKGRASIVLSTNTGLTALSITGRSWEVRNLDIDCGSLGTSTGISTGGIGRHTFENVKVSNFTTAGLNDSAGNSNIMNCEATGGGAAATAAIIGLIVYRCYVHDNSCPGITDTAGLNFARFVRNVLDTNTGASSDGISVTGFAATVVNNTCYGNGRDGIRCASTIGMIVGKNILESNGGFGINFTPTTMFATPTLDGNAFFNNTSGAKSGMDDTTTVPEGVSPYSNQFDVLYTATAFTNAAGGDFSLNSSANGGTLVRGQSQSFLAGAGTDHTDFGAVQHADPTQPIAGDVEAGVTYNDGNTTGTFTVPAAGDVRSGTGYGANGTEFTGTLVPTTTVYNQTGLFL